MAFWYTFFDTNILRIYYNTTFDKINYFKVWQIQICTSLAYLKITKSALKFSNSIRNWSLMMRWLENQNFYIVLITFNI